MERREWLYSLGTGMLALLTGCSGGDPGDETGETVETGDGDGEGDGDGSQSAPPEEDWRSEISFDDVDREVYVEASRYRFSPGTDEPIRVETGETVGLGFTSNDDGYHGGHGLLLEEFDIDLKSQQWETDSTTFVADRSGEFEFRCSVYCSDGHDTMTGTLVVEDA